MAKQSKAAAKKAAPVKAAPKPAAKKASPSKAKSGKTVPSKSASGQGKLYGKTVHFVGKFGYQNHDYELFSSLVASHGGKVVPQADSLLDYLFVGEGRGGKPPADVARVQKIAPAVHVLSQSDFVQLLLPNRDEVLHEFAKCQQKEPNQKYWENLGTLCWKGSQTIDVSKAKLQGLNLYGAALQCLDLTGSDLRQVKAKYTHFGNLEDVNFEGCTAPKAYLSHMLHCNFRNAKMEEVWLFFTQYRQPVAPQRPMNQAEGCDFSGAIMPRGRGDRGKFVDCRFIGTVWTDGGAEKTEFSNCDFTKADLTRLNAKEAKFVKAIFKNANLTNADFRDASLVGADLQNANLQGAVLSDADLTDANLNGANFQGAILNGTKFANVDLAKAKNLVIPAVRNPGPKLQELAQAVSGSKKFETSAKVEFAKNDFGMLRLSFEENSGRPYIRFDSCYHRNDKEARDWGQPRTFAAGMLELSERFLNGTLRLDSIEASGCKTLRGEKLLSLATEAWAETFGVEAQSPEEIQKERSQQAAKAIRERDQLMAKIRKNGAKVWNDIHYQVRDQIDLEGIDLSYADLDKITLWSRKIKKANFAGASLVGGQLWGCELQATDFSGANLEHGELQGATLNGTKFVNANLKKANLSGAKLQGADFTDAKLTDVNFDKAQYDEKTTWPKGFKPPAEMIWKGDGPAPNVAKKIIPAAKPGTLDFDTFLKDLGAKVESARMDKAGSMLKAERFQLFAEVKDTGIVGIVKSQSSGDLVYSCRLNSDGAFGCCTQNLRPCGGLRGALCKHLLVLIVGLAKAGQLDPATVNLWVDLSGSHKPTIEEDSMSATFLRYKGAESGELDWRPTETIPEDFYAM